MYTGILLYHGFSEYELSVLVSVLKQGKKPVVFIGLDHGLVSGEAGMPCYPQFSINQVDRSKLDSLVLPGVDDFEHLVEHDELKAFLKSLKEEDLLIGAISSAPYFLAMSGLLENKRYTTGLTREQRTFLATFDEDYYSDKPILVDGQIITARGSSYVDFAFQYGESLGLSFDRSWYGR
ncbi:DJ-1/PfpI family protein [Alkalihalobacillus sp. CinArs1]|uniref:DJ-1/PfpI family protein n=1 Tax=Alkalihalobacillus sp. CinArs1 TaxID=2995314 RepID=UPI0022DDDCC0|nr:DJ-1/PfpI family protein [Alkalihalobacillus sp. CinArs1]